MKTLPSIGFCLCVAACASTPTPPPTDVSSALATSPATAIAFIEDDYETALAAAKKTHRPLFIDAWAPWCHTCLSMRSYVFDSSPLRQRSQQFVWLAIDTEKPQNQRFVDAYPMDTWPTLWVVDPKTERPTLKWLGSATPEELGGLLDDARAAIAHGEDRGEASAAFVRGSRLLAEGKRDEGIADLQNSLATASPDSPKGDWPQRGRAAEALAAALLQKKDYAACVALAKRELPTLPKGTSLVNVALYGFECAVQAPPTSPEHAGIEGLGATLEGLASDPTLPVLADDRSSIFETLVDRYTALGNAIGARVLGLKWSQFLEGEAARAQNAAARSVFDAHRMLADFAIGQPERALPMLALSERDFPGDYNPPARIARAYLEMRRFDEALAAADRALAKGYGPRKLRLYSLKADIEAKKGDASGLKETLREAVAYGKALPEEGRSTKLLRELDVRLQEASH